MSHFGVILAALLSSLSVSSSRPRCEPITIPMCAHYFYNYTMMPNFIGDVTQPSAGYKVQEYQSLVNSKCSHRIRLFLCSLFLPRCSEDGKLSLPCRSLCSSSKNDCDDFVNEFGIPWPQQLDCRQFPEESSSRVRCISSDDYKSKKPGAVEQIPKASRRRFRIKKIVFVESSYSDLKRKEDMAELKLRAATIISFSTLIFCAVMFSLFSLTLHVARSSD
ncbi:Uncharacterised protein g10415 [Pycnogonum litorale]